MATIFPLREFAAAVAGERGEAGLLLPPGAGVHTWQPRPSDIASLSACDLLLYIGSGLEPWLPDLLKAFPPGRIRTLEAAAGLAVAGGQEEEPGEEHGHDALDPHVWLDFELDVRIVGRIAEERGRLDPRLAQGLPATRRGQLKLDAEFASLSACRGRSSGRHSAFGYSAALRPRPTG
jgi:zinc transport system substrate-binding protein